MITEYGIEAKSNSEIISELGARFKEYRLFSNLTQKEVAAKAGVSIFTISQFEKGEARNIGFGTILSLLRSIGFLQEVEKLLPPLPMLPNQIKKMNEISYKFNYGTRMLVCCRGTTRRAVLSFSSIKTLYNMVGTLLH